MLAKKNHRSGCLVTSTVATAHTHTRTCGTSHGGRQPAVLCYRDLSGYILHPHLISSASAIDRSAQQVLCSIRTFSSCAMSHSRARRYCTATRSSACPPVRLSVCHICGQRRVKMAELSSTFLTSKQYITFL